MSEVLPNPHGRQVSGQEVRYTNLVTNPRGRDTSGTVVLRENLALNPSFEHGAAGWQTGPGQANLTIESANPIAGSQSGRWEYPSDATSAWSYLSMTGSLTAASSQVYLTMAIRPEFTGSMTFDFGETAGGARSDRTDVNVEAGVEQTVTLSYTAEQDFTTWGLRFGQSGAVAVKGSAAVFDEIMVSTTPITEYADGDSTATDPDLTWGWAGTPGNSVSQLTAPEPVGYALQGQGAVAYYSARHDAVALYNPLPTKEWTVNSISFTAGETGTLLVDAFTEDAGVHSQLRTGGNVVDVGNSPSVPIPAGEWTGQRRGFESTGGSASFYIYNETQGTTIYIRWAVIDGTDSYTGPWFDGDSTGLDLDAQWAGEPHSSASELVAQIPAGWISSDAQVTYSRREDAVMLTTEQGGGSVYVPVPLVGATTYSYSATMTSADASSVTVELLGTTSDGANRRQFRSGEAHVLAHARRKVTATDEGALLISTNDQATIYIQASVQDIPPTSGSVPVFELDGLTLGGWPNPIQVSVFEPSWPEMRTQDAQNEVSDGVMVGRDYLGSSSWSLEMFTDVEDYAEALALADLVAGKWLQRDVRTTPGKVLALRYHMSDRWRRVYGRPRRYAGPDGGVMTMQGRAQITADFMIVDHLFYDDEEKVSFSSLRPTTLGGFTAPFTSPLTTETYEEGYAPGVFEVGGTASTGAVVEIRGPVTDPWVDVGQWRMELVGTVGDGEVVIVDARPWVRSTFRSDGTPVAGMVSPSTALSDMVLDPGFYHITFGGYGAAATARATIRWRDAWFSL